jgi:hypothetical protein
MHRRTFTPDGRLNDNLKPYAEAMKAVTTETKVAVIDLHAKSGMLFEKLGDAGSAEFANWADDHTHFNAKGAKAMAELVMQELPVTEPALKPLGQLSSRADETFAAGGRAVFACARNGLDDFEHAAAAARAAPPGGLLANEHSK